MGRPPKLTSHQKDNAIQAIIDGTATQADLARRFNVSQSAISRLVTQYSKSAPWRTAAARAKHQSALLVDDEDEDLF
jgi:transposase-like protein